MDKNARRKKRLVMYSAKFKDTVDVTQILCYFPKMTDDTKEGIMRKVNNEGSRAGAYEFCMKVTKADSDWYDYLMIALRKANYLELLKLLQDDDDDGNDGAACQHAVADSRTSLMKSSSANPVEQPINFPHQGVACSISANAEQSEHPERNQSNVLQCVPQRTSPQQAPPAQSTQRAFSPQSTQGASSPQSTQLASPPQPPHQAPPAQSTHWASSPQSTQGASSPQPPQQTSSPFSSELSTNTIQNIARPHERIPLSSEAYARPGEDTSRQDMTVDEVNSIHGAPQLYEVLRTRGMNLHEMGRADQTSEINKFYDFSDMDLPEQPVERRSPKFAHQTIKATESMSEPPENKQEIKLKDIQKPPPDPKNRNLDEINNKGKNVMNFEPDEQVKSQVVVERSSSACVVDNHASKNDLKPVMATAMKVSCSSSSVEQLTEPYLGSKIGYLNSFNQPPVDSHIEQSALESREDCVVQNVKEMGDAHEKEDKDGHEEEHQEEPEKDVPQNSDSEGPPVSSESIVPPRRARNWNWFSILSDGALALTKMNRL